MNDYQASLNSVTIGEGTSYLFDGPITGLGVPAPRTSDLELPTGGVLGGRDLPSLRRITLSVAVIGSTAAAVFDLVETLNTAWSPTSSDVVLTIKLPGMGELGWTGRPRGLDLDLTNLQYGVARCRLTFDALNPVGS